VIVVEGKESGKRKLHESNVNGPQKIHRISTAKNLLIFRFNFPDTAARDGFLVDRCNDFRFGNGIDTLRFASQQQAIGLGEN
jgi:hypothetical protein